ncbi:carbohydrate ABC transporter permease [Ruegeria sp. HKCCD8929]|uniref:carbohydrate ABC transporter permease n=1 Tax=Ruegeria sp. HKCCD8929 TaxID=2683006 RepID=UPI001C2BF588|nr:sugar ABC transporter permease [Ruegeria sp. HKCCD8929]
MSQVSSQTLADASERKGLFSRLVDAFPFRWWMALPLILLLGIFVLYPLGFSFYLSLTEYKLTNRSLDFIGFEQYRRVLTDGDFTESLKITLTFVVAAVLIELVLGLVLALALQKQKFARNITRALLFTPMFLAPVAVGLVFRFLLNQQLGLLPNALAVFGWQVDFFSPNMALWSMVLIDVWQWTPFMVLLMLSGLESMPKSPFEAARVDGASFFLTFRTLTLPMLAPVLIVALVIRVLESSKLFEYVFVITNGGPGGTTESLQFIMYQTGIRFFRLAEASAMAFVFLLVLAVPIIWMLRQAKET